MFLDKYHELNNPKRNFNPADKVDLEELKFFKDHNKWKNGCPFALEEPFLEIPAMCESKFTTFMLAKLLKEKKIKA